MADLGKKHRVIGVRHTLRQFKNVGLVEEDSLYPDEGVADVQGKMVSHAVTWYKIGARRGALRVLGAFLDGKMSVRKKADGSREIIASVDDVHWRKKLKVKVGSSSRAVKKTTYRLSTSVLGFE